MRSSETVTKSKKGGGGEREGRRKGEGNDRIEENGTEKEKRGEKDRYKVKRGRE